MSVATVEVAPSRPSAGLRPVGPSPQRTRSRRPGPGVGPVARPRRLRFVAPPARPRGCRDEVRVPAATVERPRSWRLTERGVTLVLLVGAALVAASVVVVGLTALRVTSESYRSVHSASAPMVVEP